MYGAWRAIRWWMRVAFGLLAGLATIYVVVDAARDEPDFWFYFNGKLLLPAAIVLGLASLWTATEGVLERIFAEERGDLSRNIDKHLYVLHRQLYRRFHPPRRRGEERTSRATLNRVGLNVWVVPSWFAAVDAIPTPRRLRQAVGRRYPSAALWRASNFRLIDQTTPTNISWQRGRGLIGLAWRSGILEHMDMAEAWPPADSSESEWTRLWRSVPAEKKLGLTAAQARKLRKNYESALAAPIYKRHDGGGTTLVAVLTIDISAGTNDLKIDAPMLEKQVKIATNRIAKEFDRR